MFSDNKDADNSRLSAELYPQEVKRSIGGRAASYGLSRLIDRPSIGDGRRNRRKRRGIDIDIPTGGIPGTRRPTGSRRDTDRDGWADEGTTKPVWVGIPSPTKKPTQKLPKKQTENKFSSRLSSGSGSKKLKIVEQSDERVKNLLQYFFQDTFDNPNKNDVIKENIQLSTDLRELQRGERLKRHYLNPFRFVEFEKSDGKKQLYMLATDNNADGVVAYDVEKLISIGEKRRAFSGDADGKVFSTFDFSDTSEFKAGTRNAIAGILNASKPIGGPKDRKNWEIYSIEVKDRHQRRGLGSALLKMHRDTWPELGLDHSESLTDDGAGFAAATPVERLSSGAKKPSWPRRPTYGAFIDGANEVFADAKTWEEFRDIYNDQEITFLDYETTGLVFDEFRKPSSNGKPVQIALIKMKGGKIIDKLDIFMNPGEPLGEWSRNNLRGPDGKPLQDDWLSEQMSIADAHKRVAEFVGDRGILGVQNSSFDKDVLDDALDDSGIDWKPYGYIDTKEIADMVLPKWTPETQDGPFRIKDGEKVPSNGLADITKYLGVDLGDKHHYASHDAEAAGLVMSAIIDGAIEKGWSSDVLDADKRNLKIQADRNAFKELVKKFEKDKIEFLKTNKPQEEKLSSGLERPTIMMSAKDIDKIKEHRQRKYKYGDKSALHEGKELRRDRNNWLEGLTPEQMADVLVPSSEEERFSMWLDDFAPGAKDIEQAKSAFKKYWDEFQSQHPWDKPDTSPESVAAMKEVVKSALESNPYMRWAFENHGAPMFALWSVDGIDAWESRPETAERLDQITKSRGYKERAYVAGRVSPFVDLTLFHPRAAIDRRRANGEEIKKSLGQLHEVKQGDAHIDNSFAGMMMHEWGHWLHYRAIRDYENKTRQANRSYYGSGVKDDPIYVAGLDIAQQYNSAKSNPALIKLHEDNTPIDADERAPRTITSYAHISPAEMMAEGITAILHPNREIQNTAINQKLKKDAEILLGGDGAEFKPWENYSAKERAIFKKRLSSLTKKERKDRLSSGKSDVFGIENSKSNSPRFEREPTQALYVKGKSPSPSIVRRELANDLLSIAKSEEASFDYIDESGNRIEVFSEAKPNTSAHKWKMSLILGDSLNYDASEIEEIFGDFVTMPKRVNGKVIIGARSPNDALHAFSELNTTDKLQSIKTKNISNFFGLSPDEIFVNGEPKTLAKTFIGFNKDSGEIDKIYRAHMVNAFMDHWTGGTSTPLAKLMQVASKQLFGVDFDKNNKTYNNSIKEFSEKQQEFARAVLSSIYDLNQSYFKSKGITHLSLYRGIGLDDEKIFENSIVLDSGLPNVKNESFRMSVVSGNPLSSWTSDMNIALDLVDPNEYRHRVLMRQVIPIEDVVGSFLTNFGTREEAEFVILGKPRPTMTFDVPSDMGPETEIRVNRFMMSDDEDFYANSKSLAKELTSQNNKELSEIAEIAENFTNSQDESYLRLSSGRIAKTKESMKQAYRFVVQRYGERGTQETAKYEFEPDSSPEGVGVISADSSVDLAKEILRDSAKILNVGPGMHESKKKELERALADDPLGRNNEISAKRAVAQIISSLTEEEPESLLSLFFDKESFVNIFPERHRETIRQVIETVDPRNELLFGYTEDKSFIEGLSEEEFLKFLKESYIDFPFPVDMPDTPGKRAAYVSKTAQIRELLRVLAAGDAKNDSEYKFRVDSEGNLLDKYVIDAASKLATVSAVRHKMLKGMVGHIFGSSGSAEPEKRFAEMFPDLNAAVEAIENGTFDSLISSELQVQAQIAIERLSHDIFYKDYAFDEDFSGDEESYFDVYKKIPEYHKQRIYNILTKYAGLSDDDMRILGYYEDSNDFQNVVSGALNQIIGGQRLAFKRSFINGMFFSADIDEAEATRPKLRDGNGNIIRFTNEDFKFDQEGRDGLFEPVLNISFYGLEVDSRPDFSELSEALNRNGKYSSSRAQNSLNEWESQIARRRANYRDSILREIFSDKNQTQRKLRIQIGEHGTTGRISYFFEDASKPSIYDGETGIDRRLQSFPDKSKWRTIELEIPNQEAAATELIDAFFTKEHLKGTISELTTSLKITDDYFGDSDSGIQISDVENVEISKMKRSDFLSLSRELTRTSELDIRTPEGKQVIKQKLASDIVRSWAQSSNKVLLSALIQEQAAKDFDLKETVSLGDILPKEFESTPGIFGVIKEMSANNEKFQISDSQRKGISAVLRAMHDSTQEYFKQKGITHITVYRGMNINVNSIPKDARAGGIAEVPLTMRPLSSWTTTTQFAESFSPGDGFSAMTGKENLAGVIVGAVVPVENILSTPLTGFGCLNENEIVLLGKPQIGNVILSRNSYKTARLMGKKPDSPDWPKDESGYRLNDDELASKALEEYKSIRSSLSSVLNSKANAIADSKRSDMSFNERLSSGAVDRRTKIKLDRKEIEKRSREFIVEFDTVEDNQGAVETLKKAFNGGYTVEFDRYSDIKSGISVGRNEHGVVLKAGEGFDKDGTPQQWLVDMFLDWLRMHGPDVFKSPREGAERVALGGWKTEDGKVYLDVVDIYPETPEFLDKAAQIGLEQDQIAVTRLSELWRLLDEGGEIDSAFINSGGRGGRTISVKTLRDFSSQRKKLLERMKETGSPDIVQVGKPTRIELKKHKNMKRVRAINADGQNMREYILLDSSDGLSVSAYSGEQLAEVIGKTGGGKPTPRQIKKLTEEKQPVALMTINSSEGKQNPSISYLAMDGESIDGLAEALAMMHRQFNISSREKEDVRLSVGQQRLSSGSNEEKRREVARILSRKNTDSLSASMRSIARDFADYRYEMNNDMADSLIRALRRLPDWREDDYDEDVLFPPFDAPFKEPVRIGLGTNEDRRKEIANILKQKNTESLSQSILSIARDFSDHRYEMSNEMADELIQLLNRLPNWDEPDYAERLASGAEEVNTVRGGKRNVRSVYEKPTKDDINKIKSATQKLMETGLNVKRFIWTGPDGKKHESPIMNIGRRAAVVVGVNGVNIPFYMSSGTGGKKNVPAGKWYPFFGVGEDGWFNKTSEEDINEYYGVLEFKSISEILNATLTKDDFPKRNVGWNLATFSGKRMWQGEYIDDEILKPEIAKILNRDLEPSRNYIPREVLNRRIEKAKQKVVDGRTSSKAGYRTRRKVEEIVDSDKVKSSGENETERNVKLSVSVPGSGKLSVSINSRMKNRDIFDLPPQREVSVYVRDKTKNVIAVLHARNARPEEGEEGKLVISDVSVNEEHQRRGLATLMMGLGTKYNVDGEKIHHSRMLSPMGALFARGTPSAITLSESGRQPVIRTELP